jgi:hypothetical protein
MREKIGDFWVVAGVRDVDFGLVFKGFFGLKGILRKFLWILGI